MKNKGFTLIELLAVIVILAIIALIAIPIVLNIVDDAGKESNERSIELYARSVQQAVAKQQLNNSNSSMLIGEFKVSEDGKQLLDPVTGNVVLEVEFDGPIISCSSVVIKTDGKIEMTNCQINGSSASYNYGVDEKKACTLSEETTFNQLTPTSPIITITSEVLDCGGEKFYVMERTDSTITMLTKYNLNISAEPYKQDITGAINPVWYSETSKEVYPEDGYIYDDTTIIYPYVEAYEGYLRDTVGLTTADAKLMSIEQADSLLGYVPTEWGDSREAGPNTPSWAYSTNYWLGTKEMAVLSKKWWNFSYSISYAMSYWCNDDPNAYFPNSCSYKDYEDPYNNPSAWHEGIGIRPVVIISTEHVNI